MPTVSRLLYFNKFLKKKAPYILHFLSYKHINREEREKETEREEREKETERMRDIGKSGEIGEIIEKRREKREEKREKRKEKRAGTLCQLPFVLIPLRLYLPKC